MLAAIAAAMAMSLQACGTGPTSYKSDFCVHASPITPTQEEVDMLSEQTNSQILRHDETGAQLCGWAPGKTSD